VGYDGRAQGRDALALGALLATALGAPLVVATTHASQAIASAVPADASRSEAERIAEAGLDELPAELESEACVVAASSPARGLHDCADERRAALVVVGSSHRGALGRVLAGTAASQLLSGSPCAVAVAPRGLSERAPLTLRCIGVGFDDGAESWNALQQAAALAAATGAAVRVIHAVPPLVTSLMAPAVPTEAEHERERQGQLATERAVASLPEAASAEARLVFGNPVLVLDLEARDDLDLLLLGSRGFGPVRSVLLGSVSAELVRQAPCPLLVVPRSAEATQR
jgi:nucleotide-binding universal stress UspA family protein